MGRMGSPSRFSRRAFIGMAAGAAAIPAATAGCQSSGPGSTAQPGTSPAASHHGPVSENSLPGYRDWDIKHVGGPERDHGLRRAVQRASRRTDHAVRVDDVALVHRKGVPDGLVQRRPGPAGVAVEDRGRAQAEQAHPDQADQHGRDALGTVAHGAHRRLAGRLLPAASGLRGRPAAVRPGHGPVGEDRREDGDQERGRDLAGLQHLGRLRPVQRPGRDHRLQQPLAGGQPRPAVRPGGRLHVPVPRAEADRARGTPGHAARLRHQHGHRARTGPAGRGQRAVLARA